MDLGHKRTDKMLKDMEKKIQKVYKQAATELEQKVSRHYSSFVDKYMKKVADLNAGKITKKNFQKWAHNQMMTGKRWQNLRNVVASDLTNADKIAVSMLKGYLPEVYALNHNYGTYEIEHGLGVDTSYTLYDRQTVERLIRDDPTLIPTPKLDENKDLRWNKQLFNNGITQGILQGESIRDIAKRVALGTSQSDYKAALRNARTATTGAENAGRIDSYERAERMGIKVKKIWMATNDGRTRDSHRHMDGEEQDYKDEFSNGLMYPGDPDGDPSEVWNCRCTLVADTEESSVPDGMERNSKYGNIKYDEWKRGH